MLHLVVSGPQNDYRILFVAVIQVQEGSVDTLAISYEEDEAIIDVGAVLDDGTIVPSQFRVSMP